MQFSKTQIAIAAGAGFLVLLGFFLYLNWLNSQPPVLANYRQRYAAFICDSEVKHPLLAWRLVDWEDRPPLRILHYSGKRHNQGEGSSYEELLSVTLDNRSGVWVVTKYDSLY